jgi:hypothetical protein
MSTLIQENLVVVQEDALENISVITFPIPIAPNGVPRTPSNEATYCHVTSLIIPILTLDENKILVVNKLERNKLKRPHDQYPAQCYFDIFGGHFRYDLVPKNERKAGLMSFETARKQAFKELCEELIPISDNIPPFRIEQLEYIGLYPYNNKSNYELSVLFAIDLGNPLKKYKACDDIVINNQEVRQIDLPIESYKYEKLMEISEKEDDKKFFLHDGLTRILREGRLAIRVEAATGLKI